MDKSPKATIPWQIHLMVALSIIFVFWGMIYVLQTGTRIKATYTPQMNAALEMKYEFSCAHLQLEEFCISDTAQIDTAYQHLGKAKWYANALLNGNQSEENTFLPLNDSQLRQKTENLLVGLKELLTYIQEWDSKRNMFSDDTEHDVMFEELILAINEVETDIKQLMSEELTSFRRMQFFIIYFCLFLVGMVTFYFLRFEQDRATDFKTILSTKKKLETTIIELTRSNRELENFASVSSHDLQEPLRKILAFGGRLETKCGNLLGDQGRDYLNRMLDASVRMQTLIEDLLIFSRVTIQAEQFRPVDLNKVVEEVLSDLEVLIDKEGARIEVGDLPTIDADSTQMRQLLQNLISNALKFHQEETLIVKIYGIIIDRDDSTQPPSGESHIGQNCQIIVKDNGIGFDEKYLDRIFNVFQRLHGREDYKGTGIGLAVCRKIAERHGGDITAKSTLGQGATFIVTLPIKQPKGDNE